MEHRNRNTWIGIIGISLMMLAVFFQVYYTQKANNEKSVVSVPVKKPDTKYSDKNDDVNVETPLVYPKKPPHIYVPKKTKKVHKRHYRKPSRKKSCPITEYEGYPCWARQAFTDID